MPRRRSTARPWRIPDAAAPRCAHRHRHRRGDLGRRARASFTCVEPLQAGQRPAGQDPGACSRARGAGRGAVRPTSRARSRSARSRCTASTWPSSRSSRGSHATVWRSPAASSKDLKAPTRVTCRRPPGRKLKRRVPEFNEFGDEFWLIHESRGDRAAGGAAPGPQACYRGQGDVSIFPPPVCP